MSLELTRLNTAHADKALVASIRENFRNHLLMALSEANSATIGMERREQFMSDLREYFNPDGRASDLFSDAFCDVNTSLDNDIQDLTDELAMAQRRSGIRVAAE